MVDYFPYLTGATVTVLSLDSSGNAWNGSAFVAWTTATYGTVLRATTEKNTNSGMYYFTVPTDAVQWFYFEGSTAIGQGAIGSVTASSGGSGGTMVTNNVTDGTATTISSDAWTTLLTLTYDIWAGEGTFTVSQGAQSIQTEYRLYAYASVLDSTGFDLADVNAVKSAKVSGYIPTGASQTGVFYIGAKNVKIYSIVLQGRRIGSTASPVITASAVT